MRERLVLVDTDVASRLYGERFYNRRVPASVTAALGNHRLAISLITVGEAHFGVRKRKWGPERTAGMLGFYREKFVVLDIAGDEMAAEYGYLRASAEAIGRPLTPNDLWIAACASTNGLPLVTLNRRDFEPLTIFGVSLL